MAPAPYEPYEPSPDDREPRYPYQEFYSGGGKKPKRSGGHGGWWVLLALAVLVVGAAALFSRFSVDIRQTAEGVTVSIQDTANPSDSEAADSSASDSGDASSDIMVLQPSAGDGGAELTVTEAPDDLPPTYASSGEGLSFQEIYQKAIPSVVSITTTLYSGSVATGSGIIMSADGYIITNEHVINGAVAIDVLTSDNETYSAGLVGSDATSDLAVLKIEVSGLTPAEFGDSTQMEVGDTVVAIGDPLGTELRGTMTDGIISAINRDLVVNGRSMTLLQTNAALNNGNSGGPLINVYGQVIGVNTMKMSSYYSTATVEGLCCAIPISTAKPIIDELIDQGYVSGRPAIGISTRELPDVVRAYYRIPSGVYVESVDPESDAYEKGLRKGDTITAIEGVAVSTTEELNVVKNQFRAGDTVQLTVYRDGNLYSVEVVLSDASGT